MGLNSETAGRVEKQAEGVERRAKLNPTVEPFEGFSSQRQEATSTIVLFYFFYVILLYFVLL